MNRESGHALLYSITLSRGHLRRSSFPYGELFQKARSREPWYHTTHVPLVFYGPNYYGGRSAHLSERDETQISIYRHLSDPGFTPDLPQLSEAT